MAERSIDACSGWVDRDDQLRVDATTREPRPLGDRSLEARTRPSRQAEQGIACVGDHAVMREQGGTRGAWRSHEAAERHVETRWKARSHEASNMNSFGDVAAEPSDELEWRLSEETKGSPTKALAHARPLRSAGAVTMAPRGRLLPGVTTSTHPREV